MNQTGVFSNLVGGKDGSSPSSERRLNTFNTRRSSFSGRQMESKGRCLEPQNATWRSRKEDMTWGDRTQRFSQLSKLTKMDWPLSSPEGQFSTRCHFTFQAAIRTTHQDDRRRHPACGRTHWRHLSPGVDKNYLKTSVTQFWMGLVHFYDPFWVTYLDLWPVSSSYSRDLLDGNSTEVMCTVRKWCLPRSSLQPPSNTSLVRVTLGIWSTLKNDIWRVWTQ